MTFTINLLSNIPFETDSIFKGTKPYENYVLDVRGFHVLVNVAKNYRFVDVFFNNTLLNERKTTVEFIMNESNKNVNSYTKPLVRDVIIQCMDAFRPVIDEYAAQLRNVRVEFFKEQYVVFNLVLAEMLKDSLLKICIPYTRMAKLFKYTDYIRDFINDILKYMISSRPELNSGHYTKIITSVSLIERFEDETDGVYKTWNEFR